MMETVEKMKEPLKLTDRLRGKYVVPVNDGAGLLDGKDTFTREFSTNAIQREAADLIDDLIDALKLWQKWYEQNPSAENRELAYNTSRSILKRIP